MTTQQAPSAPPAPPVDAAAPGGPSQEDRLLAAAAYLGYFTGFWLIVPIVVYVVRREKSRFVAHHAMRAVLLHLVAVPVGVLGAIISLAVGIGVMVAVDGGRGGRGPDGVLSAIFMFVVYGSWLLPFVVYFAVTVLAAIRAFQGRTNKTSLFGRMAEWFLKQDKSVARDTP